ncbi:MAG: CPBP family intramembrane glutamic endopeptidase [Aquihabitans sp.]
MTAGRLHALHPRDGQVSVSALRSVDDTSEADRIDRRRAVLYMAAFTVFVEILGLANLITSPKIGALQLPMSVIPALGLGVACGDRLAGRSSSSRRAVLYWAVVTVTLSALAIEFVRTEQFGLWVSLVLAAFGEEMVYRLAIPAVLGTAFRWTGVRPTQARIAGFVIAGIWFVALPGHRAQMTDLSMVLPFIAFATLSAVLVYRSGSILPMAAAHAISNLITVLAWSGMATNNARSMTLGSILVLLVLAYGRPRRLTVTDHGIVVDTYTGLAVQEMTISADDRTNARLSDGSTVEVEGPVVRFERS